MKEIILFHFVICLHTFFAVSNRGISDPSTGSKKLLPVYLQYNLPEPPDSIKTYFESEFAEQKVKIVTYKECMELLRTEMMLRGRELLNSGNFSKDNADFFKNVQQVCNVVAVDYYPRATNPEIIDSVRWRVGAIPVDEHMNQTGVFIPNAVSAGQKQVIKQFVNDLISQKALK